jgi:hypothetical protein
LGPESIIIIEEKDIVARRNRQRDIAAFCRARSARSLDKNIPKPERFAYYGMSIGVR